MSADIRVARTTSLTPIAEAEDRTNAHVARLIDALEDELHERRLAWLAASDPAEAARGPEWYKMRHTMSILDTLRKGVR